MFCVVFVFSRILQVLEVNPLNSKIITKSENSLLDRFKLQINFEFKEREVGKNDCVFFNVLGEAGRLVGWISWHIYDKKRKRNHFWSFY
jgi:hypothetical protein